MRIAMWSGPRNLSTAMMYSFAARGDCAVWDEPFFAPYLAATGAAHPMLDETIAGCETDAAAVAARCIGPIPDGQPHFYMKHMPHHMLDGFPMAWAQDCVHVHLIRHPGRVIASYTAKREGTTFDDLGFRQQTQLFEAYPGPVIDATDVRADPGRVLGRLCAEIGLPWTDAMLRWRAGPRPEDGPWAPHWYGAVHRSTGFAPPEGDAPPVDSPFLAEALDHYEAMAARRLR